MSEHTISYIASNLLLHGYNTRSSIHFSRSFELQKLPIDVPSDDDLFIKVFRKLKLLARLYPWPTSPVEASFIDIGIGGGNGMPARYFRFVIEFSNDKGHEAATISVPIPRDKRDKTAEQGGAANR